MHIGFYVEFKVKTFSPRLSQWERGIREAVIVGMFAWKDLSQG